MFNVLGRREVEALRELLHVAEAAASALESWPVHSEVDLSSREPLVVSRDCLVDAVFDLSAAINSLVVFTE